MLWILIITSIFVIAAAFIDCICTVRKLQNYAKADYNRQILIIPVTGDMNDIADILKNARDISESSHYSCRCLICDFGADKDTMMICRQFSDENDNFAVCSGEYAENLLQFL